MDEQPPRQIDGLSKLKSEIEQEIQRAQGEQFATLDFDNTCICNDIAEAGLAFMCRNGILKNNRLPLPSHNAATDYHSLVFKHYYNLRARGDYEQAYMFCALAFAGYAQEEIDALAAATIEFEGATLGTTELFGISVARGIVVRPVMRELLNFLCDQEIAIWIVSAAPEVLVKSAMKHLKIPGQVVGLRLDSANGILLNHVQPPYSMFAGKVECIKRFVNPYRRPILAVGDNMNDFAMIKYGLFQASVGTDPSLRAEAQLNGWYIIS